ncbi:hypothetical protein FB45DRAFT_716203, partial [Roridomyces roridus]
MSSTLNSVTVLPEGERFDGTGWTAFSTKMKAQFKARGLGGYIDGTISKPSGNPLTTPLPGDTTPNYSMTPSLEEWTYRDGVVTSMLVLNVKNPVGLGLISDGTAVEAWKSL